MSLAVRADEALNPRAIAELGIDPGAVVRCPATECCGRMYWDCECAWSCVGCRSVVHGQVACGDCNGGRE